MTTQASLDCSKNPIYCDIIKLHPKVNKDFALQLSNHIYKYSKQFGTDPKISIAIAMQESAFSNKNRMGTISTPEGKIIKGATDIGVFQIHVNTIENLKKEGKNIDTQRLHYDVEYQTYWHAKLLSKKIKVCNQKREKLKVNKGDEWSCYHSYTPKHRKVYLKHVNRHLSAITSEQ